MEKKEKTVVIDFISIVHKSKRKSNNFWYDQGKEFYNSLT